jgi:hypothetical protein
MMPTPRPSAWGAPWRENSPASATRGCLFSTWLTMTPGELSWPGVCPFAQARDRSDCGRRGAPRDEPPFASRRIRRGTRPQRSREMPVAQPPNALEYLLGAFVRAPLSNDLPCFPAWRPPSGPSSLAWSIIPPAHRKAHESSLCGCIPHPGLALIVGGKCVPGRRSRRPGTHFPPVPHEGLPPSWSRASSRVHAPQDRGYSPAPRSWSRCRPCGDRIRHGSICRGDDLFHPGL